MNTLATVLLVLTGVVALADWIAVGRDNGKAELITKPLTLVLLISLVQAIDPFSESMRWWFFAGLCFSLVGDIALLPKFNAFITGLSAFLIAHLAYIVGLAGHVETGSLAIVGIGVALLAFGFYGRRILANVPGELLLPVVAYFAVLSAMVIFAFVTGIWFLAIGAVLFLASDSLLGWGRFVSPSPGGRVAVHITYHLAQTALVIGLI
jgi:uncharacterized membrane protein YhhN